MNSQPAASASNLPQSLRIELSLSGTRISPGLASGTVWVVRWTAFMAEGYPDRHRSPAESDPHHDGAGVGPDWSAAQHQDPNDCCNRRARQHCKLGNGCVVGGKCAISDEQRQGVAYTAETRGAHEVAPCHALRRDGQARGHGQGGSEQDAERLSKHKAQDDPCEDS